MDSIINQSFKLSFKVLSICRLYPKANSSVFYTIQAFTVYILFIVIYPILSIIHLAIEETDIAILNYNAMYLTQAVAFNVKILPFITNIKQIKECIYYFDDPAFSIKTKEDKAIKDECILTCQKNAKIFLLLVTSGVMTWTFKPMFFKGHRVPMDFWLPLIERPTEFGWFYVVLYITSAIACGYIAFGGTIVDPVLAGLAMHAAGRLKMLQNHLINLHEVCLSDNDTLDKIKLYDNICECIEHHNMILVFVEKYEKCFSNMMLSQFASSVIVICCCALQVNRMEILSFDGISVISYVAIILAEIYFYCYYGQMIFDEHKLLIDAVCMGKWDEYDCKSKKALICLMERTQRPLFVKAGKIFEVSVNTFTLLLRRSYSLVAVLKNYQ